YARGPPRVGTPWRQFVLASSHVPKVGSIPLAPPDPQAPSRLFPQGSAPRKAASSVPRTNDPRARTGEGLPLAATSYEAHRRCDLPFVALDLNRSNPARPGHS